MAAFLDTSMPLSVVIFGATGDLARKKLFPALYQLIIGGHFPKSVNIVGFGRREVDMPAFLAKQCVNVPDLEDYPKADYLQRISFCAGGAYDKPEGFQKLHVQLSEFEAGRPANRLFFLSVPPTVFGAVAKYVGEHARGVDGFTHLIIEKPFGRDSASFATLDAQTSSIFDESQIFRIDHYLGKEVVLNMSTLRFANQLFEPGWSSKHIASVEITFKEDLGTGGRGGYFDGFGIIRDIMQNHLLQVFVLTAMEPPASAAGADIQAAKVELLRRTETLSLDSDSGGAFLGQFTANKWAATGGALHEEEGYKDDPGVPADSTCPTFAAVVLRVNNERWRGVPFLMKAGKGLDERLAEVRVTFKPQPFNDVGPRAAGGTAPPPNELVCRIQPDEALYLKTHTKDPGLGQTCSPSVMDMRYKTTFDEVPRIADAYERMFLNAAKGDGSLFVSAPELVEAWRIFTPLLHAIDERKPAPVPYPFGSRFPPGFNEWSQRHAGVSQARVSVAEHLALVRGGAAKMRAIFDQYDVDKSGALEPAEVRKLARDLYDGREPPQKKVDQIFGLMGAGADGVDPAGGGAAERKITFEALLEAAHHLHVAFGVPEEQLDLPSGAAQPEE